MYPQAALRAPNDPRLKIRPGDYRIPHSSTVNCCGRRSLVSLPKAGSEPNPDLPSLSPKGAGHSRIILRTAPRESRGRKADSRRYHVDSTTRSPRFLPRRQALTGYGSTAVGRVEGGSGQSGRDLNRPGTHARAARAVPAPRSTRSRSAAPPAAGAKSARRSPRNSRRYRPRCG